MTLVIGITCKEGVLIVADRKVIDEHQNEAYVRKIESQIGQINLAFATSGYDHLFYRFKRQLPLAVQQTIRHLDFLNYQLCLEKNIPYKPQIMPEKIEPKEVEIEEKNESLDIKLDKTSRTEHVIGHELPMIHQYTYESFLGDCRRIIRDLCTAEDEAVYNSLNLLLAMPHNDRAILHYIDFYGEEKERDFQCIGSGESLANLILNKFLKRGIENFPSAEYALKLAYFCIFFVEALGFDKYVGVEEDRFPDNTLVGHDGSVLSLNFKEELTVMRELKQMVKDIKDRFDVLKF